MVPKDEPVFVGMLLHRAGETFRILPSTFEATSSVMQTDKKGVPKTLLKKGCFVYTNIVTESMQIIHVDESEAEVWEIYVDSVLRTRTLNEGKDPDIIFTPDDEVNDDVDTVEEDDTA